MPTIPKRAAKKITARRRMPACSRTPRALLTPVVSAEVHPDDHALDVTFNAAAWFAQATDDEIRALAKIGWGGNYESDRVAEFFQRRHRGVGTVFTYLRLRRGGEPCGFECHVVEASALAWLAKHRPALHAELNPADA